jgi:hypothetical protein
VAQQTTARPTAVNVREVSERRHFTVLTSLGELTKQADSKEG